MCCSEREERTGWIVAIVFTLTTVPISVPPSVRTDQTFDRSIPVATGYLALKNGTLKKMDPKGSQANLNQRRIVWGPPLPSTLDTEPI